MNTCGDQKRAIKSGHLRVATLLAALPCAAFLSPAQAAPSPGQIQVTINQGVNIVKNADLHFGDFIAGTVNSRFRINPNTGTLTQQNGDAIAIGGTPTAASFTAFGTPLERVRITVADNRIFIVRDGGTETMRINRFRFNGGRNRFLNAAGEVTYNIGGQLRIRANQIGGTYRGTFNVTIDYF